jgi:hypothetical protein
MRQVPASRDFQTWICRSNPAIEWFAKDEHALVPSQCAESLGYMSAKVKINSPTNGVPGLQIADFKCSTARTRRSADLKIEKTRALLFVKGRTSIA